MPRQTASEASSNAAKPAGLAYLVGRLDHVLNKRLRDGLAPLGMTVPHYTALSVFRVMGTLSNAQLAERTMVSPQSANEMVKAMEAKGWIERSPDPSHGRIIRIGLTDAGLACLRECDAVVRKVEEMMFPELSDEERTRLHAQLRSAVRSLSVQGL
ncbi:MarR family winged helix-turn-helix transcriptional regulator [Massilia sp. TN1-12]|uniref:MarR family winged helix-turn-helix transcriptional regulator n=1 Tax=Massilia paldalensis TaxID=3377675 RepID=UPI003850EBA6